MTTNRLSVAAVIVVTASAAFALFTNAAAQSKQSGAWFGVIPAPRRRD